MASYLRSNSNFQSKKSRREGACTVSSIASSPLSRDSKRTRSRVPYPPTELDKASGMMIAPIPQSRLTVRFTYAQNPPSWAGFKSLESRLSRKGSCVSQFRTPDAPEMWQCQTKSFLGNLVRFKTCDLDLRNSLKTRFLKRSKKPDFLTVKIYAEHRLPV